MPGRERVNVVWFKCTDLRCHDHAALKAAHQGERGMRHVAVVTVLFRKTSTFETTGSERKPDWAPHKCTLNYATTCWIFLGSITTFVRLVTCASSLCLWSILACWANSLVRLSKDGPYSQSFSARGRRGLGPTASRSFKIMDPFFFPMKILFFISLNISWW